MRQIIEAGNSIARTPYKWGGGHGKWQDTGYDCSGSVSFALAAAGLLDGPLASGPLMSWGKAGKGKWVTIYANAGHVYLEVAGIRFDTSGARVTGSRWQNELPHQRGLRRPPPAGPVSRPERGAWGAHPIAPARPAPMKGMQRVPPEENRLPDDPLPPLRATAPDRRLRSRTRSTRRGSGLRRPSTASTAGVPSSAALRRAWGELELARRHPGAAAHRLRGARDRLR